MHQRPWLVVQGSAASNKELQEELKALGYSDAEIFDMAATAAGRAFFTKLLDAMGVTPDAPFRTLPESLRRTLTVGRPIDEPIR